MKFSFNLFPEIRKSQKKLSLFQISRLNPAVEKFFNVEDINPAVF